MKTFGLLLVFLRAATGAPDIDTVLAAARSAPPEFAADAMIRIARSGKVEKARQIELLEQAFERAGEAQKAYPRHAAAIKLDGSSAYWNRLYKQDLDTMTLRLR